MKRGRARVGAGGVTRPCTGRAALAKRGASTRAGRSVRFAIAPGARRTLNAPLTPALRKQLGRRGRAPASLVLALDGAAAKRRSVILVRR